jgi:hypothetical protein
VRRDEEERATGEDERARLAAHRARCSICRHPERKEIEREFLDWVSPREIAEDWKLPSYRAIYRHAHAVGLFERRRENRLTALDAIIERVQDVPVTASAVVAAIRLSLELEGERRETKRQAREPGFLLSLEGLPRTNAVTGVAPDDGGTLQCGPASGEQEDGEGHEVKAGPAAGMADSGLGVSEAMPATHASPLRTEEDHRLKPMPPERRGVGPANGGGAGADLAGAPAGAEAQGTQAVASEPDPRIVLGEDGRVAGIPWPWPKQKIAFARVGRRWRGREPR